MIWRLTYCNKEGVEARLDIIKGSSTPVEVIEGTATPFVLNYKMDKPDKSGFFMTSSADISIFETTSFNIDSLKTSSETEIKVEHYIDNILDWAGFVIPDFFSKTIGSPSTVEMVASDRLATLKGVTLTDLNQYVSMRDLAVACLAHTGLSLPLYTMADFGNDGQTNAFFKALGLSSRLSDTKGRNISCYDILKSILVASNSKLVQQDGAWHIVNKWQHEQGTGNLFSNLTNSTPYNEQTINFSDVHVGGRRSIVPVAAITGVYHEFGGGRSYPDNFNFRDFGLIPEFNFPGWTKAGTFNVARGDKEIIGYSFDGQMQFGTNTVDSYFFNSNVFNTSNYLQMDGVPVPYTTGQIEVVLDLNATAQTVSQFLTNVTAVKIAVGAVKDGSPTIWLNNNGIFAEDNPVIHNLNFDRGATYEAQTKGFNLKGVINNPEGYSIIMRIYGSRDEGEDNRRQIAIHFARIEFKNTQDAPKGIIYKRKQGTDFTKEHDIDTTIFGDYMRKGLDGYFYEYPFDDTSSLYRTAGTLTQPLWTAPNDAEQLPLLHHITRQKSRMFSLAHNMTSARINVSSFKPLSIFIDCNSERYVVVSATYDFLRSEVEVELEQIAYATLNVRDFIYSYFGDGESGISSVGGISGGGGGSTGGGLTPEQIEILSFWKKDPDNPNTIFTEMNAYSKLELSAYGAGDGGGGGSDYERLDAWADYDSTKSGWVLSAFLGNDLNTRVTAIDDRLTDLENTAGSGSVTSVGISVPTGLSVSNSPITSSGVIAIGLQAGYSIPTTVKQGQWDTAYSNTHTHANKTVLDGITSGLITNWNTAFGWGNHASENYFNNDYLRARSVGSYDANNGGNSGYVASYYSQNWLTNGAFSAYGGLITWARLGVGLKLQIQYDVGHGNPTGGRLAFRTSNSNTDNDSYTTWKVLWHSGDFTQAEVTNWREVRTWWQNVGQYLKRDTTNQALYTDENFYSTKEVSAYGIGTGGGSGGGIIETVYGYGNLGQTFNNSILTDTFNAYTINQINTRLVAVESGSATSITTTGVGNAITSVSKSGNLLTFNKGLEFSLSTHNHDAIYKPIGYVPSWSEITSKPTTLAGYGITNAYTKTEVDTALALKLNKSVFDDLFEKVEVSTGVFAIKAKYDFYSIGEVSAYGLGSGGSGGGSYDRLDAWADYDSTKSGWVLSALLGNELNTRVGNLNTRVGNLEGGSALTVNTTGTGNAITSISKSGTVITASKGATFSLDNHLHTGVYEPVFTKNTAFNKNFGTTAGTVAQGNDSRIINGQTAYNWGNHASAGYALSSALSGYVPTSRTITAGNGLTGGGALSANRTLTLGTPSNITLSSTNSVATSSHTHNLALGGTASQYLNGATTLVTIPTITAGNGLTGGGQLTANRTLTLGTPSNITATSTNSVTATSHTHKLSMGSGSGLDADLLDGKHGYQYRGELNLGSLIDYEQVVIALVNLDNSNPNRDEWAYGQMTNKRSNGVSWNGGVTNFAVQKKYNSTSMDGYLDTTSSGIQLCTFTYNGTKYGGIRYYPTPSVSYGYNFMYYRGAGITPFMVKYRNNSGVLNAEVDSSLVIEGVDVSIKRLRTGSNIYAFTSDNVASATKLQTARTIAGVSFDGTANIAIPFANLSSKPTTLGGYGITDAVTLNTAQTITGAKTFSAGLNIEGVLNVTGVGGYAEGIRLHPVAGLSSIWFNAIENNGFQSGMFGITVNASGMRFRYGTGVSPNDLMMILNNGNVGIGTSSPQYKLDVSGTGRFTGAVTTTKVIFNAAGWSMEQVGSELQMKHNNVLKMRFTSTGSIVATEEITAFG